ncbi:SDR family oxidoreductase [Natronolimnohabitans innermongolicus]|uniref:Peroxisomal trans-2-enoyl-CoA reductase n=1 Tax=Natronolimnohabitans innermongolicus JCM 12255 TaxID=1227499 RepID=L9XBF3_9EURY|nr:SDR family oxidoreductase [Natronolimnohabitans innermongolicus]ELY59059.1 dehydrogenase/ reductase 10 [Natronolimnohabitans innermongolicus JCM 12255]
MSFGETPPSTDVFADDLLTGETALITGGGTGIGKALALAYADHGADVAIASRSMEHLEPVAEEIESKGVDACATTVDVREPDAVDAMVETVLEELGDLSILVNNAGANFLSPAETLSANGWRSVVGTILDGTANCTFAAGEHMIEREDGGAIISMGATNSVRGAPYHAHSGAGKAGVHNLMQTIAAEWAEYGIRANTVAPGVIRTEGVMEVMGEAVAERVIEDDLAADRLGTPADCVSVALFLSSPAAAYVTGSYYAVDGGQLLAPTPM